MSFAWRMTSGPTAIAPARIWSQIDFASSLAFSAARPAVRMRRRTDIDFDANRARPVSELDLSVRSRKALDTLNIATVGQLCETSEDALLACKNFGQTSLNEIKKKLADMNLSLRS